jgi:hypothetical protein
LERIDKYLVHISSLLAQDHDSFRVVVSGCLSTSHCKRILCEKLGSKVSYNWITARVPVGVSFNHSVLQAVKEFGPAEGYVYVDSGVDCGFSGMLAKMDERRLEGHAMVHVHVDEDTGFEWNGIHMPADGSDLVVPIGHSCNLHMQMFGHELLEAYGKLMPDVFASDTSESIFTFMCAAIRRKMMILGGPVIRHQSMMDGASSGFQRGQVPFRPAVTNLKKLSDEGWHCGFGYEECSGVCLHDPAKYGHDGFLVSEDLRVGLLNFIKTKMFLQEPHEYDYVDIEHEWTP